MLSTQIFQCSCVFQRLFSLLLNGKCQAFAGLQDKFTSLGCCICQNRLQQFFKARTAQGALCAHDAHAKSLCLRQGGFERRLYANECQIWKCSAQAFDGHSRGRVACHHHRFDRTLRQQLLCDEMRSFNDKLVTAFTVGRKAAVCPIHKTLLRHFCTQGLQHTQATNTAVKNANEA